MTAQVILVAATQRLEAAGIGEARLNAELLLAHLWKLPRLRLLLDLQRRLAPDDLDEFEELLERRATREPLQHITGSVNFLGHEIRVSRAALIPRPETESVAQHALDLAAVHPPIRTALDLGTGTGCIAIALAALRPHLRVHAVDVSPDALNLARQNAANNGVIDRIEFHLGDCFDALGRSSPSRFDLIVSNPPYIPTAEIDGLDPEVRDHDPRVALDGGSDGLAFYRRLALEAPGRLSPGGSLVVELGDHQARAVETLFRPPTWIGTRIMPDLAGMDRVLATRTAGSGS